MWRFLIIFNAICLNLYAFKTEEIQCSICECDIYRLITETGPWHSSWYFSSRVLNFDFKFKRMSLELSAIGLDIGIPTVEFGILPVQFLLNFPLDIYFKIKGNVFSLGLYTEPFDLVYGILFYYCGDASEPINPLRVPRIFLLRLLIGKKCNLYLNDKIFIKFSPELKLIPGYEVRYSAPLFLILAGIEVGLGRRLK